jgi:hypothetical protein
VSVTVGCKGGDRFVLHRVVWTSWTAHAATASTTARVHAAGHVATYKVALRAYRPKRCRKTGQFQFMRLRVTFIGRPGSGHRFVEPFSC